MVEGLTHRRVAAIDPGDRHAGWTLASGENWDDAECGHGTPEDCLAELRIFDPDLYVIERFSLDLARAAPQSGSEMDTARMIARIQEMAADRGAEVVFQGPGVRGSTEPTPYWKRFCTAHGRPRNRHARDSALHFVHWKHLSSRGPRLRFGPRASP